MIGAGISAALLGFCIRGLLPPPVAWVALVPLVLTLDHEERPLRSGLLTAFSYMGLLLAAFEGAVPAIPWAFPAAVTCAAPAAFVPGAVHALLSRRGWPLLAPWSLVFSWTAAEYLSRQRWIWGQFASPVALGYTQVEGPLLGLASLGGVSGVGFAVLTSNVAISLLIRRRSPLPLMIPLALIAGGLAISRFTATPTDDSTVEIAIVQPSLEPGWYEASEGIPQVAEAIAARLLEQTVQAQGDVDLLVWPEAAVPGNVSSEDLLPRLAGQGISSDLLAGTVVSEDDRRYNSVLHIGSGEAEHVFDKLAPVPFGEAGVTPGNRLVVGRWGGSWTGLLVCLDSVYPVFALELARLGAELIVVLSDDSFARGMATPDLHLRSTVFRAVETGLPVLFASASGPSAFIDSNGRILASAPRNKAEVLQAGLPAGRRRTPYFLFGDILGKLSLISTVALLALALGPGARSSPTSTYPSHDR